MNKLFRDGKGKEFPGPKDYDETGADDIFIKVNIKMTFTSNDKYEAWSFIFTVVFISLGILALFSFLFFLRMTCVYQNFSMERR